MFAVCLSKTKRVAAAWTSLFFLVVAIRVCLPPFVGETICVVALLVGTTVAFTCWNGPGQHSNSNGNGHRRVDHLEAIELQQSHDSNQGHNNETALASTGHGLTADTDLNEEDGNNPVDGNNAGTTNSNTTDNNNNNGTSTSTNTITKARLPFIDNLKTFLTSLVVTHHVACAFGGCGEGSWYLIVGEDGSPAFRQFVKALTLLNQSYFMSLFFFISAYFVPSSYAQSGGWRKFQSSKRRRILIPALFVFFVVSPAAILISGKWVYFPNPGPAWFLFWLLLFNLVYASFSATTNVSPRSTFSQGSGYSSTTGRTIITERCEEGIEPLILDDEGVDTSDTEAVAEVSVPNSKFILSTGFRIAYGIGICGLSLIPFLILELGSLASMPLSVGSLNCDFFMFYLGLQAKKHGWFDTSLIDQLDVHPMILACFVAFEGIAMVVMGRDFEKWFFLLVIIAGVFCLDMSLFLLVVFQRWANFETRLTHFLAKGAYGVYLLHPIVVTGTTQLYVNLPIDGIKDQNWAYFYPIGFIFVAVVSHMINWPLSYFLAQLPYLKNIL